MFGYPSKGYWGGVVGLGWVVNFVNFNVKTYK